MAFRIVMTGMLMMLACLLGVAQNAIDAEELNCYSQWERVFKDRGAYDIDDGEYTDVVVSIRQKSKNADGEYTTEITCKCYSGKAEVKNGRITGIYIKVVDNTFEKLDKKYKYFNQLATIDNGISRNIITQEGDLVNVIFAEKLKPKSG